MGNRVRMLEVSERAKVSPITVSRALRQPQLLKPATLKRVREAISALGYLPDLNATSLASRKSAIIGAIVPTFNSDIFARTIYGLQTTLAQAGYQLLLGQSNYSTATEEDLLRTFLGRRVDGVVLTGTQHSVATVERLRAAATPAVETWALPIRPIDMAVGFSNHAAGAAMGRYLQAKGYETVAFVCAPEDRSRQRLKGLQSVYKKVPSAVTVHWVGKDPQMQEGRIALSLILKQALPPRAIFFGNDSLAVSAIMECQRRKLRVPQDIAIAGFSDQEVASEVEPGLTTVRIPSAEIGIAAAQMLLGRLLGRREETTRDLGFEVVARQSA